MFGVLPAAAATLALLVATNVAQNGNSSRAPPAVRTLDDVFQLGRKADFVAAWRAGSVPANYQGKDFDGYLLSLGILAPMTAFITNNLFGPFAIWRGKSFAKSGAAGRNRFGGGSKKRGFAARVAASQLDHQPALVLDYSDPELLGSSSTALFLQRVVVSVASMMCYVCACYCEPVLAEGMEMCFGDRSSSCEMSSVKLHPEFCLVWVPWVLQGGCRIAPPLCWCHLRRHLSLSWRRPLEEVVCFTAGTLSSGRMQACTFFVNASWSVCSFVYNM